MAQLFAVSSEEFNGLTDQRAQSDKRQTYLTVMLGEEEYGVPILQVLEIVSQLPLTRVPSSPRSILGVANLRGRVIPVLSLRRRFQLPDHDKQLVVVVEHGSGVMGLAVDHVHDVAALTETDLEPPPNQGLPIDMSFVTAIVKTGERIRILLDIGKVITQIQH